jgi:hypothetical protein
MIPPSNNDADVIDNVDGLSRRAVLAVVGAGALTSASAAVAANTPAAASFGAPLVEMCFPVGVLPLEQKAAMIRSVTDVVNSAMKLPADPARRLFVEIIETPEGGFGVNGQPVVVRGK